MAEVAIAYILVSLPNFGDEKFSLIFIERSQKQNPIISQNNSYNSHVTGQSQQIMVFYDISHDPTLISNRPADINLTMQKFILQEAMLSCLEALSNESATYRPLKKNGTPGGLIRLEHNLEAVMVPDLHGRHQKIKELLVYRFHETPLEELLAQGRIYLIFCGDYIHSEARGAERWRQGALEYGDNFKQHEAMDQEMSENMETWIQITKLKAKYPTFVHLLKGNHENIMDSSDNPNRKFYKYAYESSMTTLWCQKFLGIELLKLIHQFEQSLPLLVQANHWILSHAQPDRVYSRTELIQAEGDVGFGLTWTRKNDVAPDAATGTMENLLGKTVVWFAGHSAISSKYHWDQDESTVLFHNPNEFSVIHMGNQAGFDPSHNVVTLPNTKP